MGNLYDKIGKFVSVPVSFVECSELSSSAFRLFIVLRRLTNNDSDDVFPSYTYLQKITGMGRETISHVLDELELCGWIERKRRFGKSTVYTLLYPKEKKSSSTKIELLSSTKIEL